MASTITKEITGFCPKSQTEKTISINYAIGTSIDGIEFSDKGTYLCSDKINCQNTKCPIYENAPKSI